METEILCRLAQTFNGVRDMTQPKWEMRQHEMKTWLHQLGTDLAELSKLNNALFVRALAMEAYISLFTAKSSPCSLIDKKNMLHAAYEKLKHYNTRDECLFVFLRIQNLLCYYMIQLNQLEATREILEALEDLYEVISRSPTHQFIDAEDLFTTRPLEAIKHVDSEKIDKIITNNVQMQGYVYSKLNMPERYMLYAHTALRRQLEMKDGTPQDWAVRTARLGTYFADHDLIENARIHLSAAFYVLRTCHDHCNKLLPSEYVNKTGYERQFQELSHHMVRYGFTLFKLSKKKLLSRYFIKEQPTSEADLWNTVELNTHYEPETQPAENGKQAGDMAPEMASDVANNQTTEKPYTFPSLATNKIEEKIPDKLVVTPEQSRKLFSFTNKWLSRAKRNYDIDSCEYVTCALQLAELYEHMAFFERDLELQYVAQRRRASVLEAVSAAMRARGSDVTTHVDVIRELSQAQLELMALNLQRLWRIESHTDMSTEDGTSMVSLSNRTLNDQTAHISKSTYLRRMEAAVTVNKKLVRLSSQVASRNSSNFSFM